MDERKGVKYFNQHSTILIQPSEICNDPSALHGQYICSLSCHILSVFFIAQLSGVTGNDSFGGERDFAATAI